MQDPPAPRGAWAVIATSSARASLAQIGFARLHGPVLELETAADVSRALDRAVPLLSQEHPLVIVASPGLVEEAGGAEALAELSEALLAHGVARLMLAGEGLFGAVLERTGRVLRPGPEIAPALAWCAVDGAAFHLAFKPGAAGGRDILLRAFLTEA